MILKNQGQSDNISTEEALFQQMQVGHVADQYYFRQVGCYMISS